LDSRPFNHIDSAAGISDIARGIRKYLIVDYCF